MWCQIDSIGPPLSPRTCDSCKAQKFALAIRRTHDFFTHLSWWVWAAWAQLVSWGLCFADGGSCCNATVRNEELRLYNVGILQSSSLVLAARLPSESLKARPWKNRTWWDPKPISKGGKGLIINLKALPLCPQLIFVPSAQEGCYPLGWLVYSILQYLCEHRLSYKLK